MSVRVAALSSVLAPLCDRCVSVCLSVCLSVCVCVCLSVFLFLSRAFLHHSVLLLSDLYR
jgi:hypothetical protein